MGNTESGICCVTLLDQEWEQQFELSREDPSQMADQPVTLPDAVKLKCNQNPSSKLDKELDPESYETIESSNQLSSTEDVTTSKECLMELETVELSDGRKYTGQWKGDVKEGYGVYENNSKGRFEGQFMNDHIHGFGKYSYSSGELYEGQWEQSKISGYGKFVHTDGSYYVGQWKGDQQNGKGKEVWANSSSYDGNFCDGKKHGYGVFKWANGTVYEGSFEKNHIEGYGVQKWPDGRVYSGQWKNNSLHGLGKFTFPDGKQYVGQFENDRRQGKGVYTWPDGSKYDGQWKDGKQSGYGIFTDKENAVTTGMWYHGQFLLDNCDNTAMDRLPPELRRIAIPTTGQSSGSAGENEARGKQSKSVKVLDNLKRVFTRKPINPTEETETRRSKFPLKPLLRKTQ